MSGRHHDHHQTNLVLTHDHVTAVHLRQNKAIVVMYSKRIILLHINLIALPNKWLKICAHKRSYNIVSAALIVRPKRDYNFSFQFLIRWTMSEYLHKQVRMPITNPNASPTTDTNIVILL